MKRNILIIGATSAIAQEVAKNYAKTNDNLFLVGQNMARLDIIAKDLRVRGAENVILHATDLNAFEHHEWLLKIIDQKFNPIDIVLIAYGTLPNQKICEASFNTTLKELVTNYISTVSLLTILANYFEKRKSGTIAVISSVAGDRGRQSNYVYGSAKGGLTIFLQGLRNRLSKSNINVLTIKPGFVDTPMTKNFKKGLLWVRPEYVGNKIVYAINNKRNVIYVPFFWHYIMMIIKSIPENIFKRLSL